MQAFKIETYLRDNPTSRPPQFTRLTEPEVTDITERLLTAAGRHKAKPKEIIQVLLDEATPIEGLNLDQNELPLREVFRIAGISPGPALYVQWEAFRDIDRFQIDELDRRFYDVWYPAADDIEIFDVELAALYPALRRRRSVASLTVTSCCPCC